MQGPGTGTIARRKRSGPIDKSIKYQHHADMTVNPGHLDAARSRLNDAIREARDMLEIVEHVNDVTELRKERDLARATAARLQNENALLASQLGKINEALNDVGCNSSLHWEHIRALGAARDRNRNECERMKSEIERLNKDVSHLHREIAKHKAEAERLKNENAARSLLVPPPLATDHPPTDHPPTDHPPTDRPITREMIRRLRELHRATTPGGWYQLAATSKKWVGTIAEGVTDEQWRANHDADAAFVAASHAILPLALDEIERLRKLLSECPFGVVLGDVVACRGTTSTEIADWIVKVYDAAKAAG